MPYAEWSKIGLRACLCIFSLPWTCRTTVSVLCYIDLIVFEQTQEAHYRAHVRFATICSRPNQNSVTVVLSWLVKAAIQYVQTAAMSIANVLMGSVQHVAMTYCQR